MSVNFEMLIYLGHRLSLVLAVDRYCGILCRPYRESDQYDAKPEARRYVRRPRKKISLYLRSKKLSVTLHQKFTCNTA